MRLAKYRMWGFEVLWSGLERSRVDPRIYQEPEPIDHLNGLARLLALERLFDIAPCKARPWPHLEGGSSFSNAFRIPYGPKYDAVTARIHCSHFLLRKTDVDVLLDRERVAYG
jgi:hypothetical protein